jgi:poly(3-hydroxybutyrate) depolymerase
MSRRYWRVHLAATLLAAATSLSPIAGIAATIEPGNGEQSVALPGATLQVFTYRPAKCSPGALLVVFHGIERNAGPYRDHAKSLADKLCAVVVAPKFDRERFPRNLYQYGGIAEHGRVIPPGSRSVDLVAPLVAWAQGAVGQPGLPYVLLGFSAGGQFLSRVAAYTTTGAVKIVIGSPSTWVMPSTSTPAPFGFGGIEPSPEQALRAYLAQPVIVALGGFDTGSETLDVTVDGMAQGPNRLARGRNAFNSVKAAAESHGWPFNWTLIEVPYVGHNSTKMFDAPETVSALMELGLRRQ